MQDQLAREWGSLAFKGVIAVLFGIAAVFWPGLTLVTLVYLFSGFVLAIGLVTLVVGLTNISNGNTSFLGKVLTIVLGIAEIGVGVYLLRHPEVSFATFILIAGLLLIANGVIDIVDGLFEGGSAMRRTVYVISGVIAGLAGVLLLFQPEAAGIAFVWILGLYALLVGPLTIALALDTKQLAEGKRRR